MTYSFNIDQFKTDSLSWATPTQHSVSYTVPSNIAHYQSVLDNPVVSECCKSINIIELLVSGHFTVRIVVVFDGTLLNENRSAGTNAYLQ